MSAAETALPLTLNLLYFGPVVLALLGYIVFTYVTVGKSLSAIARRRGIDHAWLAWVPVGCDWLLGCISDHYRYVSFNQQSKRRTRLLWYNVAMMVIVAAVVVIPFITVCLAEEGASENTILIVGLTVLIPYLAMFPVAVVYSIEYYKSFYDLFRSCDPDKSMIYLLVSIFATLPLPFFLRSCHSKDLGMPQRRVTMDEFE